MEMSGNFDCNLLITHGMISWKGEVNVLQILQKMLLKMLLKIGLNKTVFVNNFIFYANKVRYKI